MKATGKRGAVSRRGVFLQTRSRIQKLDFLEVFKDSGRVFAGNAGNHKKLREALVPRGKGLLLSTDVRG